MAPERLQQGLETALRDGCRETARQRGLKLSRAH